MHRYPITVLKFGSSVLCCEADLSKAVQEFIAGLATDTALLRWFRRLVRLPILCSRAPRHTAPI
jgi:hypothetical protein